MSDCHNFLTKIPVNFYEAKEFTNRLFIFPAHNMYDDFVCISAKSLFYDARLEKFWSKEKFIIVPLQTIHHQRMKQML